MPANRPLPGQAMRERPPATGPYGYYRWDRDIIHQMPEHQIFAGPSDVERRQIRQDMLGMMQRQRQMQQQRAQEQWRRRNQEMLQQGMMRQRDLMGLQDNFWGQMYRR